MAQEYLTEDEDDVKGKAPSKQEEYTIVEEDPAKKPPQGQDDDIEDYDDEDPRPEAKGDVDPEDPDDNEREAIRERRRKEKAERKERRERAINRDKLELEFLRKRNDDLERRIGSVEQRQATISVNTLDQELRQAVNEVEMAEKVIAKAVAAGNGEDVAQAMRYRDQAMAKAQQLNARKQQATQAPQQQAPQIDERTMHYAKEFLAENKWYDPQGRDEDSAIVLAIDQTLIRDGYRSDTAEYWDELRRRAGRRLPDKFNPTKREPRGGPSVGGGREHTPTSSRKEVYISPERKQALIDAGVWDDPVLRHRYVKRYMEFDKANRK